MTLNSEEGVLPSDPGQPCYQGSIPAVPCDTGLDLAVLSAAAVYLRPAWLKRGFFDALLQTL